MELATPEAFSQDPHLVWEFYQYRRRKVAECEPNPGHRCLARYQEDHPDTWIITQNIDDLHRRAGSSLRLLEMHGNLWHLRCLRCPYREENRDLAFERPPVCPRCQSLLRPDVVWFGEGFEIELLVKIDGLLARGGVMLVIGTSGAVSPGGGLRGHRAGPRRLHHRDQPGGEPHRGQHGRSGPGAGRRGPPRPPRLRAPPERLRASVPRRSEGSAERPHVRRRGSQAGTAAPRPCDDGSPLG
jgi:hypothetical protein